MPLWATFDSRAFSLTHIHIHCKVMIKCPKVKIREQILWTEDNYHKVTENGSMTTSIVVQPIRCVGMFLLSFVEYNRQIKVLCLHCVLTCILQICISLYQENFILLFVMSTFNSCFYIWLVLRHQFSCLGWLCSRGLHYLWHNSICPDQ